jgi:hypothetical protein
LCHICSNGKITFSVRTYFKFFQTPRDKEEDKKIRRNHDRGKYQGLKERKKKRSKDKQKAKKRRL